MPGAPRRGACLLRAHQPARLGWAGGRLRFPPSLSLPLLPPCVPVPMEGPAQALPPRRRGGRCQSAAAGDAKGLSGKAGGTVSLSHRILAARLSLQPSRGHLPPCPSARGALTAARRAGRSQGYRYRYSSSPPPPPASFFSPSLRRGPRAPRACPSRPPRGRWAAAMFSGGTAGGPSLRYGFPPPHPSPKLKRSGAEAPPPRGKGKGGVNARVPCARHCLQGRAVRGRLRGR